MGKWLKGKDPLSWIAYIPNGTKILIRVSPVWDHPPSYLLCIITVSQGSVWAYDWQSMPRSSCCEAKCYPLKQYVIYVGLIKWNPTCLGSMLLVGTEWFILRFSIHFSWQQKCQPIGHTLVRSACEGVILSSATMGICPKTSDDPPRYVLVWIKLYLQTIQETCITFISRQIWNQTRCEPCLYHLDSWFWSHTYFNNTGWTCPRNHK